MDFSTYPSMGSFSVCIERQFTRRHQALEGLSDEVGLIINSAESLTSAIMQDDTERLLNEILNYNTTFTLIHVP